MTYLMKSGSENVDRRGRRHVAHGDIFETAALTALLTMLFVVVLAVVKILREPDATRRQI